MAYDTQKAAEATASSGVIPAWLSFVFFCLFVGGCVSGGCSATAGFRSCFKPVVDAWRSCTEPTK